MWKLDRKEEIVFLNCGAGEDSWESLGHQDQASQSSQPWIFIGGIDAEARAPILRSPDVKSQLIGEDPDAGEDWRQKEKGAAEDKMGWMASLTQCTWIWANSRRWWEGQESLVCCSPWGHKELDTTWRLNYQHNFISEVPFKICL